MLRSLDAPAARSVLPVNRELTTDNPAKPYAKRAEIALGARL
jgi:hypothetical protein